MNSTAPAWVENPTTAATAEAATRRQTVLAENDELMGNPRSGAMIDFSASTLGLIIIYFAGQVNR
jgi:hypothetical protein